MAKKEVFTPIWSFDDGDGEKAGKKKTEKVREYAPARSKDSKTGGIDRGIYSDKEDERLRSFRVTQKAGEEKKPLPRKTKLVLALVVLLLLAVVVGWLVLNVRGWRTVYSEPGSIAISPMIKPR